MQNDLWANVANLCEFIEGVMRLCGAKDIYVGTSLYSNNPIGIFHIVLKAPHFFFFNKINEQLSETDTGTRTDPL